MAFGMNKDEKKEQKAQEVMAKYGLDKISNEYRDAVMQINTELAGSGMIELGAKLSMSSATDNVKMSYLNTLIQQNWIIIRQLDEISKKLEK